MRDEHGTNEHRGLPSLILSCLLQGSLVSVSIDACSVQVYRKSAGAAVSRERSHFPLSQERRDNQKMYCE